MKKIAILVAIAMGLICFSGISFAQTGPITLYYGDTTIDGTAHWMPGSWNLDICEVTVSYELDLTNAPNNACNSWGGCPGISHWSSGNVGLVWPGSTWAGAWMSGFLSDWDNPSTMFPTFPDIDNNQDLDDKFNMARSPNPGDYDEKHYDVDCTSGEVLTQVGSDAYSNYGIWFDRDGVDPYQPGNWGMVSGGTYNTNGIYQVEVVYNKSFNYPTSKGVACATFFPDLLNDDAPDGYGIPTGFKAITGGGYQYFPYGISFETDQTKMADMQVFVSGGVYTDGAIIVRNLTVTGCLNLEDGMATGGGWFIPETNQIGLINLDYKATFGFVAKQKKGTSSGQLEFQYHGDGLILKSTSYDWVTVASTQAMFEGIGTINGSGSYKFRVRAVDGDKLGTGIDRFEIRIWTGGGTFDSPTYRAEGDLGGGQIVVQKK